MVVENQGPWPEDEPLLKFGNEQDKKHFVNMVLMGMMMTILILLSQDLESGYLLDLVDCLIIITFLATIYSGRHLINKR